MNRNSRTGACAVLLSTSICALLGATVAACGDAHGQAGAGAGAGGSGGQAGADAGGAGGSGKLGSSQIGIGRAHDPSWVEHYGKEGDEDAWAVHASQAGVYVVGQTSSAWFGPFVDPCSAAGDDAGEDCGDAFALEVVTGIGIQFGAMQTDTARAIDADGAAVYLAGASNEPGFQRDAWISSRSSDLAQSRWDFRIENAKRVDEVLSLSLDDDVFVAGGSAGQLEPPTPTAGVEDAYAMRLTATGNVVAVNQFGTPKFEEMMGVAADADGVYLTGQTGGYLGAEAGGKNLGSTDVFLAVLDRSLDQVICQAQFGTSGKDVGQAIAVSGDALYVVGWTEGTINGELADGADCNQDDAPPSDAITIDAFVAKYDKQCHHVWTRQFGGKDGDVADTLTTDGQYVYVVGTSGGGLDHVDQPSSTDGYLRVYDASGAVVGEIEIGSDASTGDHADFARGVSVYDGFIHIAGRTEGDLGGPGSNLGGADAFLAKIPIDAAIGSAVFEGTGCP